ncbi:hypothetical protein RHMOL_Rhmol04G0208700 [Rhododendron molle]|uniref:Uncharacterized protein n=1 Tax=Rhododendron molle TaxID=49168 RepID=A0ACC0P2K1_RHOML|nr:hypothetical protein RHMOL_Rhmol04G0208700 [Rhododendron molle]
MTDRMERMMLPTRGVTKAEAEGERKEAVSYAGSQEERPSNRQRLSGGTEEEPIAVFDETEEPTDIDLEDTSKSTVPRVFRTQEVASSEAKEEDEEEGSEDED